MADETRNQNPAPGQNPPARPAGPAAQPKPGTAPAGQNPTAPAAAASKSDGPTFSPYIGPSEIIPGGVYRRPAKMLGGKPHGGDIADAHGTVLATFAIKEVNTGWPGDGELTEDGKVWMKEQGHEVKDDE